MLRPSFKLNPLAERRLANTPQMAAFLGLVGRDAAQEVERQAPDWLKRRKGTVIRGGAQVRRGRVEGYVEVDSPFWHIDEFGTIRNPPRPYLRPGVQASIIKRAGRLGGDSERWLRR